MGPICPTCDEPLGWTPHVHVCKPEVIEAYVHRLKEEANTATRRLEDVRDAVFRLLEPMPQIEKLEEVTVSTEFLRKLWQSAQCQWHEAKTPESFLVRWIALHRILCEAFDLFRSKKYGKVETLAQKLTALKEACNHAQDVLGYKDSNLDLTPEDLANPPMSGP